jgi:hypothetical protein
MDGLKYLIILILNKVLLKKILIEWDNLLLIKK